MQSSRNVCQAMSLYFESVLSLVKPHDTVDLNFEITTHSLRYIQEKWRNVIANQHQTMDKCDILTR